MCAHPTQRADRQNRQGCQARVDGRSAGPRCAGLARTRGVGGCGGECLHVCCRERSQRGQLVARAGRKVVQQIGGSKRAKDWDRVGNRESRQADADRRARLRVIERREVFKVVETKGITSARPGKLIVERIDANRPREANRVSGTITGVATASPSESNGASSKLFRRSSWSMPARLPSHESVDASDARGCAAASVGASGCPVAHALRSVRRPAGSPTAMPPVSMAAAKGAPAREDHMAAAGVAVVGSTARGPDTP